MDEAFKDSVCLGLNNSRFFPGTPVAGRRGMRSQTPDMTRFGFLSQPLSSEGPGRQRSRAS